MCGIFGYIGTESPNLKAILAALHHRGPDSQGSWQAAIGDRQIYLLHTRLAILDLSPAGHQPMIDSETGNVIVFNGEIYNFLELRQQLQNLGVSFHSNSDTEVLLLGYRIWGEQLIDQLDGMFAFLLFDRSQQRLLIARDHIGIKPLYYAQTRGGGIAFASEVRSLIASELVKTTYNPHAIYDYLCYGSMQEPTTLRQAIKCFPAAHYGWLDLSTDPLQPFSLHTYWSLESIAHQQLSPASAQEWHQQVLQHTLNQQLIADVPLGLFLSAGIDSTALASLLVADYKTSLATFTLGINNTADDESTLAAATAQALHLNHILTRLTPSQMNKWVIDGLKAMDQPSSDGLNTYLISRAAIAEGIKVVLSGCGADELHGGYAHFQSLSWLYRLGHRWHPLHPQVLSTATQVLSWRKDALYQERLQRLFQQIGSSQGLVQEIRRYFTPRQIQMIYPLAQNWHPTDIPINQTQVQALDIKTQISLAEIAGYLKNTLLRDSDWATMANHQELRVPYLGKRYMETVIQIPWSVKYPPRQRKYLLASQIPQSLQPILKRPKTGFVIDYGLYLKTYVRDIAQGVFEYLNDAHGFQLNRNQIDQDLKRGVSAKQARRYWALTSLGFYLYHHR